MTEQEHSDPDETLDFPAGPAVEPASGESEETIIGAPDTTPDVTQIASTPAPQSSDTDPETPEFIGRYSIQTVLGRGAFGIVYRGHDEQLDRDVAIKIPLTAGLDEIRLAALQEEFLSEARRLAKLSHPGIVRVLDVSTDKGVSYIVSEFLDGPDLNRWTRANSPDLHQVLTIVAGIADALSYAHSQRTVHRDMKPANVILTQQADGVRPVVVDFGLALGEAAENSGGELGTIAGTPNYMAPEQVMGLGHRIDGRTDIYALGVILYRLLCGRLPFTGSISAVMKQIVSAEPIHPRQIQRDIPAGVEAICLKAMAREIGDRYSTAGDMAAALRAELDRPQVSSTSTPARPAPARKRQDAVRRQVTVVSCGCDLFESEEFLEDVDPEDQHAILRQYDEQCRDIVSEFDGRVIQSSGAELVVCFGYPTAHEDAAERAVRTARRIVALNKPLQKVLGNDDIEVCIWAGVHTGQAVLQEGENGSLSMMGDARNIATRMENVSEDNAVVVTEATWRLISTRFECDNHGKLKVKGVSRKIGIYLVESESEARHKLDATDSVVLTPIVGRENELALLFEAWEQAEEGDGQLVCILGEAGLGKSRLVREIRDHASGEGAGNTIVEWRCSPFYQNTILHPVIDYISRHLSLAKAGSPENRLTSLVTYLDGLNIADDSTISLFADMLSIPTGDRYPALNLSPARQKAETLLALTHWLTASADDAPLLFIVEDLHWIDATTIEWIAQLAGNTEDHSVLVVLTFRPEFETPWGSRSNQSQIALNRLTRAEITVMIQERTGLTDISDDVVSRIVGRTEGVPLFIEEFCNTLMESGALQEIDGEVGLDPDFDMSVIPSSLQDLLVSRLDRLDTRHDIVFVGATLGREFSYQMIRAVTELDDDTLQSELQKLVHAEIVFRDGTPPQAIYTFKHALIQDAAYDSLLKKRRIVTHGRIAAILETEFPEVVESEPELLAHHFSCAEDAGRAVGYWLKAGQLSQSRSANSEAIGHYRHGLEVIAMLDDSPEKMQHETHFQLMLVTALMGAKGYSAPEVDPALMKARRLCEQLGDPTTLVHVMWLIWAFHLIRADYDEALTAGDEMMRIAEAEGDDGLIMEASFPSACTNYFIGDFRRIHPACDRGLPLYDVERCAAHAQFTGQNSGVTIRNFNALAHWHLGSPDTAREEADATVRRAYDIDHPFSQVHGITEAAWVYYLCRDGDRALKLANDALEISSRFDFPFWEACAGNAAGGGLILLDQVREGIQKSVAAFELFRSTGGKCHQCFIYTILAHGYYESQQFDTALKTISRALTAGDRTGERFMHPELLRIRGEVLKASGEDPASVAAEFRKSLQLAEELGSRGWTLRTLLSRVRLATGTAGDGEAMKKLESVFADFSQGHDLPDLQDAKQLIS